MLDQLTYNLQQHLKEGQVNGQGRNPLFIIRPQNINLQDWKYRSSVVFIRHSQKIRRHNVLVNSNFMTDVIANIGLKQFQSSFTCTISLVLHEFYICIVI